MVGSLKDLSSYDVEISNIKNDMEDSNRIIEDATKAILSFNKTIQEQNKVVDDLNQKVEENNATAVSAKILEFEVDLNLMLLACHKKSYLICDEIMNFRNIM